MSDHAREGDRAGRPVPWLPLTVGGGVIAAVVSLWVLPATLSFDPWAWMVWGREVLDGSLDTTGGPSWKPFPVLITTPLSIVGPAAPTLWLVLARAGGLLTMVLTGRVAFRLASRVDRQRRRLVLGASVLAGAVVLLTPDGGPRWLRVVGEGHADPLAAGFVLLAIDGCLATERGVRRFRHALFALGAASLIRPEAWPLLLLYGIWVARPNDWTPGWLRSPGICRWLTGASVGDEQSSTGAFAATGPTVHWTTVVAVWSTVPLLWFGGDLWGSGDFWHGADAAQVGPAGLGSRLWLVTRVIAGLVPIPVWLLAAVAVAVAWRNRDRAIMGATLVAGGWAGTVSVLTALFGYAALRRFFFPTVTLTCVLAGVGLVHVARWVLTSSGPERGPDGMAASLAGSHRPRRRRLGFGVVGAVLAVVLMTPRVVSLADRVDEMRRRHAEAEDLDRVADAVSTIPGGVDDLTACGPIRIEPGSLLRPMLPWLLEVPLHDVHPVGADIEPAVVFAFAGGDLDSALDDLAAERRDPWFRSEFWTVVAVECDPPDRAG